VCRQHTSGDLKT